MSLYSHYDLDDDFERAHDRLDDEIAALSERAVKAEAEADRLRGLIMEHRAAVFIATPIATANHQLWREALDRATKDGDE